MLGNRVFPRLFDPFRLIFPLQNVRHLGQTAPKRRRGVAAAAALPAGLPRAAFGDEEASEPAAQAAERGGAPGGEPWKADATRPRAGHAAGRAGAHGHPRGEPVDADDDGDAKGAGPHGAEVERG